MIRLGVDIGKAQNEIDGLIRDAGSFVDCRFGSPLFKKWKEDIHLFLSRTYNDKESREKWLKFCDIQFWDAGWDSYISSGGPTTPENSGLGEAIAILIAWKEDLSKRKGEHQMDRIIRVIEILLGIATVGGLIVFGVAYFNQSNQNIINTGSMGNVSIGDHSVQKVDQK